MTHSSIIAQHLTDVHEGGNWTDVNLAATLNDVTAGEATTRTPASANTIEALLNHITCWNRIMIARIKGIQAEVPENNGFDTSPILTEAAWQQLKLDNIRSAHELAAAMKEVPEARLPEPILPRYSSTYKNLQGTVEHVHYHLGQIAMLKQLVRAIGAATK